jgi:hypothetical protein
MQHSRVDSPDDAPQQPQRPPSRKGYQLGPRSRSICAYCGERVPTWTVTTTPPRDNEAAWAKIAKAHGEGCRWVASKGLRRPQP